MIELPERQYGRIMTEHFDIRDKETRKTLLNVNEADQNQILVSLASKLYDAIITKVDHIDFGTIPNSKGDITEIDNYQKLVESIQVMKNIVKEYKQDPSAITEIETAINNIKERKDIFKKGFDYKSEFIIVTYCTMVLAVVGSISLMISSCIEFIKTPTGDSFKTSFDKVSINRSKDTLLYNNIKRFNVICKNKSLDKSLNYIITNQRNQLVGVDDLGMIVGITAIATVILNIIPILRELIFFFFYSRARVSDYFEVQSKLLQLNAYDLENKDVPIKKSDKNNIVKKQLKIANFFKKISNTFSIDRKTAENKAEKEMTSDNKKYKTNEILDKAPDSVAGDMSLF